MMNLQAGKINQKACEWIAKLHDADPSPQELAELREWMQQSPEHKAELRRMSSRWGELNVLTELAVPVVAPDVQGNWMSLFLYRLFSPKALISTVATAALLTIAIVLWPQLSFNGNEPLGTQIKHVESATYATDIGEQKLVTLSDDSTVLLNTNSQVSVGYSSEFRDIRLLQGEAHFNVSTNPDRPFRVYAGKGMVRAVGTAFSVYLKEKVMEVTVTEGSIEIKAAQGTTNLNTPTLDINKSLAVVNAGQNAIFNQDIESIESIETIDLSEITRRLSWHEGLAKIFG